MKETMADLPPAQIPTDAKDDAGKNEASSENIIPPEQKSSQAEAPEPTADPQVSSVVAHEPSRTQANSANASVEALSGSTTAGSLNVGAKDTEGAATPNESSEPGWENVSQQSQADEKQPGKEDWEGDDSKLSTWEHVSATVGLKEAPPPAVNPWQKRAMDQQAKSKDNRSTQAANLAVSTELGSSQHKKSPDLGLESTRQDTKQKIKNTHSPIEDKDGPGGTRGNTKQGDGKSRNDEGRSPWADIPAI